MSTEDPHDETLPPSEWKFFHDKHRAGGLTLADLDLLIQGVLFKDSWNSLEKVNRLDLLLIYSARDISIAYRYSRSITSMLDLKFDDDLIDAALQILRTWNMESVWKPVVTDYIRGTGAASHRDRILMLMIGLRNSYELLTDPGNLELFKLVYATHRDPEQNKVIRRLAYNALAAVVLKKPPERCDGQRPPLFQRTFPYFPTPDNDFDPVVVALIERRIRPFHVIRS